MLLDGGLGVQTRFGLLGGYVFLALSYLYEVSLFVLRLTLLIGSERWCGELCA
jgi:hypothetical protein